MNIYEAISKITDELPAIPKTRQGQGISYKFRGIDDIYMALQPLMAKYKVSAWPEVLSEQYETVTTKSGGFATNAKLKVKFKFVCADDPEKAEYVTTVGEALDYSDKATNKAMSAADKYACLLLFKIPTEEAKDTELEHIEPQKRSVSQQVHINSTPAAMPKPPSPIPPSMMTRAGIPNHAPKPKPQS